MAKPSTTSAIASTPQQIPPQFRYKRLYSFPYPINGDSTVPVATPIELTKYAQTDYFSRLLVIVSGTVTVTGTTADAGTATGFENPEALLVSALLQTTPQLNGVTPVNQLSARGLIYDAMFQRGYIKRSATPILNTTAVSGTPQSVYIVYEI